MSKIKFSFEGEASDLLRILSIGKRPSEVEPLEEQDWPLPPSINGDYSVDRFPVQESIKLPQAPAPATSEPHDKDHLSSAIPLADHDSMSISVGMLRAQGFDFDQVPLDPEAWQAFVQVVREWRVGFQCPLDSDGKPTVPQPNRVALMERIGIGRWPIFVLKWVAHYRCLQEAVFQALDDSDRTVDLAESIAMTFVQVSHTSFPDLADFYDHSTRWRRSK